MTQRQPGSELAGYRLRRRIGVGSFAEVWLADPTRADAPQAAVALKILKDAGSEDKVEAFLKEARLSAKLRHHPNTVDLYEVGAVDGVHFVAMEFVDNGSLSELIARVHDLELKLPASVIVEIGLGIAAALQFTHSPRPDDGLPRGLVHRDLKPANVLLSSLGGVKVADFGMAKVTGEATATATGMLKGTPAYVAPEIWQGGREFAPRVDLFALGCVLVEMFSLERLVDGTSIPEIFARATMGDPTREVEPVRQRCAALAPVAEGLLQRDPEARTQTADEAVAALEALRTQVPGAGSLEDFLALLDFIEGDDALPSLTHRRWPRGVDGAWDALFEKVQHRLANGPPPDSSAARTDPTDSGGIERAGRSGGRARSGSSGTRTRSRASSTRTRSRASGSRTRARGSSTHPRGGSSGTRSRGNGSSGTRSRSSGSSGTRSRGNSKTRASGRTSTGGRSGVSRARRSGVAMTRRRQRRRLMLLSLGGSLIAVALMIGLAVRLRDPGQASRDRGGGRSVRDLPVVVPATPRPLVAPAPQPAAPRSTPRPKRARPRPQPTPAPAPKATPTPAEATRPGTSDWPTPQQLALWERWRQKQVVVRLEDGGRVTGVLMAINGPLLVVRRDDGSLHTSSSDGVETIELR